MSEKLIVRQPRALHGESVTWNRAGAVSWRTEAGHSRGSEGRKRIGPRPRLDFGMPNAAHVAQGPSQGERCTSPNLGGRQDGRKRVGWRKVGCPARRVFVKKKKEIPLDIPGKKGGSERRRVVRKSCKQKGSPVSESCYQNGRSAAEKNIAVGEKCAKVHDGGSTVPGLKKGGDGLTPEGDTLSTIYGAEL